MIPIKLTIDGFLSYQKPVEVDFTGFNLACISGTNGAGKSSLLDAITWVLFGNARRNDDSVINSHVERARVELIFHYENAVYRVAREKPRNKAGTLEFNIRNEAGDWQVLTAESIRATEARICETLRMQYDTFINASFFLQGKADQFAQQKPSDRKRILSSILGLERWETYQNEAASRRKQVQAEIDILDGRLTEISNELNEEDLRRQKLAEIETQKDQITKQRSAQEAALQGFERLEAVLTGQRQAVERMESDLLSILNRKKQLSLSLDDRQKEISESESLLKDEKIIEARFKEWESVRREKEKLDSLALRFHELESQCQKPLQQIASERGKLQQELDSLNLRRNEAPNVRQELTNIDRELPLTKAKLDAQNAIVENRSAFDADLHTVTDLISQLSAENGQLKETMQQLRERMDQLQAVIGADCPLCGQPLSSDHRTELLASLEKEGKSLADRYRRNQQTIKEKTEEKIELGNRLKECDQAASLIQEIQRMYDQSSIRRAFLLQKQEELKAAEIRSGEIQFLLSKEDFAEDARVALKAVVSEMEALGFDAGKLERLTAEEKHLRQVDEQQQEIKRAKARLEPLRREAASLSLQIEEAEKEIYRRTDEFEKAKAQLAHDSEGLPDIPALRQELARLRQDEARLISEAGGARQRVQGLDTLRDRQVEINNQRTELTRLVARYKTLERAFGKDGVQALLIEEALPEIETQANEILDRLSGGSMSVQFATQKEYKDKNRYDKRETLDILIGDGAGVRAYELFSGGEAFRVNIAIRLALSRVLAHRAGARLQTLVIDEGFGSQDVDGRQRLIETINLVQQDFSKILVITHLEELKEAFPARIEVEKSEMNGSRVSVVL